MVAQEEKATVDGEEGGGSEHQQQEQQEQVQPKTNNDKVKVHFVPVGSAPIMKKTKFQMNANQRFVSVHAFLRKVLKLQGGESLFLYINSAFCPGPEEVVGDLNDCFAKRGEIVVHYSLQEAWG